MFLSLVVTPFFHLYIYTHLKLIILLRLLKKHLRKFQNLSSKNRE